MKRIGLFLILLVLWLLSQDVCFARVDPVLWLTTDPGVYQGSHPDSWYDDSWITGPSDFTLNIFNSSSHGNAVTVDDIFVVFSIKDIATDFSFEVDGTDYELSDFINSGSHPVLDPHGIFGANTLYLEHSIGSLSSQQDTDIDMESIDADPAIFHMDAYGKVYTGPGEYYYAKNPYSHDATWDPIFHSTIIPEPATMSLLGLGLVGVAVLKRRRTRV